MRKYGRGTRKKSRRLSIFNISQRMQKVQYKNVFFSTNDSGNSIRFFHLYRFVQTNEKLYLKPETHTNLENTENTHQDVGMGKVLLIREKTNSTGTEHRGLYEYTMFLYGNN